MPDDRAVATDAFEETWTAKEITILAESGGRAGRRLTRLGTPRRVAAAMRISGLRIRRLQTTLARPMGPRGDVGYGVFHHTGSEHQQVAVVEVETDVGLTGVTVMSIRGEEGVEYLAGAVAPVLLGRDPTAIRRRLSELRALDPYDRGVVNHLEFALWDLLGKEQNLPVFRLLGAGAAAPSIQVYAGGGSLAFGPIEEVIAEARRLKDRGFRAMKLKVGHGPEEDLHLVAHAREAIGDELLLAVDANRAYSLPDAVVLAEGMTQFGVAWFEEPLLYAKQADDSSLWSCTRVDSRGLDDYRSLRAATRTPIAGAEGFTDYGLTSRLLTSGCLDVLQSDAGALGLIGMLSMLEQARLYGVGFTGHVTNNICGFIASLHLQALTRQSVAQECETIDSPFFHTIFVDFPRLLPSGRMAVPSGPGLGVVLNEETCATYGVAEEKVA